MKTWPDWPAAMKRATAAAYCDLSLVEFDTAVASAKLPPGFTLGRCLHWSRIAIDEHLGRLSGDLLPDWREQSPLYSSPPTPTKRRSAGPVTTEQALAHLLKLSGGKLGPKLFSKKP